MSMGTRMPPRYLPTLTEVVDPQTMAAANMAVAPEPASDPEPVVTPPQPAAPFHSALPATAVPDRNALAQQLIQLVRPQLEAELRHIAQELFEAQFSALLPSMHLHIEEAVREALEQALPEPRDPSF